jgi:hypothetical protein
MPEADRVKIAIQFHDRAKDPGPIRFGGRN